MGERRPSAEDFNDDLTFGETAAARSEKLIRQGEHRVIDGEERLVYEWKVGLHYHRRFTLSRAAAETTGPNTVYHLAYEELDPRNGPNGRYDFSQAQGIHETSQGVTSAFDELAARGKNITVPELHRRNVLEFLASEALKDTGF